jgi:hypothetical protein
MTTVNVAGFQRARRLEAERKEAKRLKELDEAVNEYANKPTGDLKDSDDTKVPADDKEPEKVSNEPKIKDLTVDVDFGDVGDVFTKEMAYTMAIEDVKAMLEAHKINFAHNTGEKKLREKLANVIN